MASLHITADFDTDGTVRFKAPGLAEPGRHPILVVVEDQPKGATGAFPNLSPIDITPWPSHLSLRREDQYGEHGR